MPSPKHTLSKYAGLFRKIFTITIMACPFFGRSRSAVEPGDRERPTAGRGAQRRCDRARSPLEAFANIHPNCLLHQTLRSALARFRSPAIGTCFIGPLCQ